MSSKQYLVDIEVDGKVTSKSFVVNEGLVHQFLKADGSIDSNSYALVSQLHAPVTLGTTNGLSISTQVLSLALASSTVTGALSSTDWNTFNNKQAALGFTPENIANKSDSYTTSSSITYASTKALVEGLGTKQNTLTNPTTGAGSNVDPNTYALQDGTILYHSVKWFAPTGAVSTSGTTVTSVGTQFTSAMVRAKLIINGEWRIIKTFTNSTNITVESAYSQNYSGVVAGNWGVFSISYEAYSGTSANILYNTTGGKAMFIDSGVPNAGAYSSSNGLFQLNNNGVDIGSGVPGMRWSSTTPHSGTKNLGLRRNSAGVLEIYNGVTADGSLLNRRDLLVRNVYSEPATLPNQVVTKAQLDLKADLGNAFTAGRVPYTSSASAISDSSRLLWYNTNSSLEVNGNAPRFTLKNNLNNFSTYFTNNAYGDLFLKNHQDKTLAVFTNPVNSTDQPQMAIGNVSSIPTESQLYVYGGMNGANIDARGSATVDEANIDLEGNDWTTSPNSLGFSYFGSKATSFGTMLGYPKNKLGIIRFQETNYAIINSEKVGGISPIRFGINDIEIGNVNDKGFSYQSDFSSVNSSNPRWLVDKGYVDTGLSTKQPVLNGTGFVKVSGTSVSYDNSTYQTVGATHYVGTTLIANNRASAKQQLAGVISEGLYGYAHGRWLYFDWTGTKFVIKVDVSEFTVVPMDISGNATTATNVAWSGITDKPTTLAGYGISETNLLHTTGDETKDGSLTVTKLDPGYEELIAIKGITNGNGYGVYGESSDGSGVYGWSVYGIGVNGQSSDGSGVYGYSNTGMGLYGSSNNGVGVYGYSNTGIGVYGYSNTGIGLLIRAGMSGEPIAKFQRGGVDKVVIQNNGAVTASTFNGDLISMGSVPAIFYAGGYKTTIFHKPVSDSLIIAHSNTNGGTDWNWSNKFVFSASGILYANSFQGTFLGNASSATTLNIGNAGHIINDSAWAGVVGYPGYTFSGGNSRFGFSSNGGNVDVYADGNFYATDYSYLVLHTGNFSSYALPLTGGTLTGNVIISTANNSSTTYIVASASGRSATVGIIDGANMYYPACNGGNLYLGSNTTNYVQGAISANSSITATAFYQSSDIRLKAVVPHEHKDPTDIKAISYLWKAISKGKNLQLGYSAQEVQKYIPNAVSKDDNGMLSVNYTQVLIAKIEMLENRIKQLENGI